MTLKYRKILCDNNVILLRVTICTCRFGSTPCPTWTYGHRLSCILFSQIHNRMNNIIIALSQRITQVSRRVSATTGFSRNGYFGLLRRWDFHYPYNICNAHAICDATRVCFWCTCNDNNSTNIIIILQCKRKRILWCYYDDTDNRKKSLEVASSRRSSAFPALQYLISDIIF